MVGSRVRFPGLLFVAFAFGCSSDPNPTGHTGGAAGSSAGGSASQAGGSAGGNSVAGSFADGGSFGVGGSTGVGGSSIAGYAGDMGIAGSSTGGHAGDVGIAGSYTGGYAGTVATGGAAGYAGTVSTGGAGGSGGVSCESLIAQASSALVAARQCNPTLDSLQCTSVLSDLCGCQFSVNTTSTQAINAYTSLKQQISSMSCMIGCTDIACPPITTGTCQTSASSSTGGICVGFSGAAF